MDTIEELNAISGIVVKKLRKKKLANGNPFLIWSSDLPKDQSYLEYPDHSIKVVTINPDLKSFNVVRELTSGQAELIRQQLKLT